MTFTDPRVPDAKVVMLCCAAAAALTTIWLAATAVANWLAVALVVTEMTEAPRATFSCPPVPVACKALSTPVPVAMVTCCAEDAAVTAPMDAVAAALSICPADIMATIDPVTPTAEAAILSTEAPLPTADPMMPTPLALTFCPPLADATTARETDAVALATCWAVPAATREGNATDAVAFEPVVATAEAWIVMVPTQDALIAWTPDTAAWIDMVPLPAAATACPATTAA